MKLTLFKRTILRKTIKSNKRTAKDCYIERNVSERCQVDLDTFKYVIETAFFELANYCIDTKNGVLLPYGIGALAIGKFKPRENSNSHRRMQHTAHTRKLYDEWLCKWLWLKNAKYHYGRKVPPMFTEFKANRKLKKLLHTRLLTDTHSEEFYNIDKKID